MDDIRHERSGHRGAFVWLRDGVIIDHTDVYDRLRGQGAGKKLVHAAVEWARAEKAQLLPLCPFARSVFDKTPGYSDVLTPP
jgi:predicted GNAT family acetyltransferase